LVIAAGIARSSMSIRTSLHLPSPLIPRAAHPAARRSKTADQLLLELIPAIKSGTAKLVNNRKKRERCENPD
jgi:hypothetical protein